MILTFHEADAWTLRFDVTDAATGDLKDLNGASVTAVAQTGTDPPVGLPASISGSTVIVSIPADTLAPGPGTLQARVSMGPDTQTFTVPLQIRPSLTVPA